MICPHCKKVISRNKNWHLKERVYELRTQGYSFRDIETLLERQVSAGQACRWMQEKERAAKSFASDLQKGIDELNKHNNG